MPILGSGSDLESLPKPPYSSSELGLPPMGSSSNAGTAAAAAAAANRVDFEAMWAELSASTAVTGALLNEPGLHMSGGQARTLLESHPLMDQTVFDVRILKNLDCKWWDGSTLQAQSRLEIKSHPLYLIAEGGCKRPAAAATGVRDRDDLPAATVTNPLSTNSLPCCLAAGFVKMEGDDVILNEEMLQFLERDVASGKGGDGRVLGKATTEGLAKIGTGLRKTFEKENPEGETQSAAPAGRSHLCWERWRAKGGSPGGARNPGDRARSRTRPPATGPSGETGKSTEGTLLQPEEVRESLQLSGSALPVITYARDLAREIAPTPSSLTEAEAEPAASSPASVTQVRLVRPDSWLCLWRS